jgi:SET domain-containing protein
MTYTFKIKKSSIQGKGAFAIRDIKKGEVLGTMQGEATTAADFARMFAKGDKRQGIDPFQVGVSSYIQLRKPYIYINHSYEPNVGIRTHATLVALRPIRKGEELVYDYSATEWTPQNFPPYYGTHWPMACRCGSKQCRKLIGCFPYIPKETQKRYLKSGVIQMHIKRKLSWPRQKQRCFICEEKLRVRL